MAASILTALAVLTPMATAQEGPDAPRAGVIEGVVTDEATGLPIENAFVSASGVSGGSFSSGFTNEAGEYRITPNNGEYLLRFSTFGENYIPEYHDNVTSSGDATIVIVEPGESQTIDAALRPGAEIAGRVRGGGVDLQFASVRVFNENFSFVTSTSTGADGRYRASGLEAGTYTVLFLPPFGVTDLAGEYWNNAPGRESATFLDVADGSVTNGVNAILDPGGSISGRIKASDTNAGLGDVLVDVTRVDTVSTFGDFWISPSPVTTAANGTYTISGLSQGDWVVEFSDLSGVYVTEYYNNKADFATANRVAVGAGEAVSPINATLALGGTITGMVTVTGTGEPLDASVFVYSDAGAFSGFGGTDNDGVYEVNGLATGKYVVQFLAGSEREYYRNKATFDTANRVNVVGGEITAGIDADMDAASPSGFANPVCDFNGDRYHDLAVGVPFEDLSGVKDAGMVNVIYGSAIGLDGFTVKSQRFSQELRGIRDEAEPNDHFGHALACGDFNGDGYSDLAVGVPDEDVDGVANAGAVNVIYGSITGLTGRFDQIFTESLPSVKGEGETGDRFGYSLAAGDFNDDGRDDLAIGVPMEDVGNKRDAGEVHVLYGAERGLVPTGDQIWNQNSPDIAGVAGAGDMFGYSLAAGELNSDGKDDLAIGVPFETVSAKADAGAVNVIYGALFREGGLVSDSNDLFTQADPKLSDAPEPGDNFGYAVAIADIDTDGLAELIVGVPGETFGGKSEAGAVNIFYDAAFGGFFRDHEVWTLDSRGVTGAAKAGDRFGTTLTIGDYDGDFIMDFSAGAPSGDVGPRIDAGYSMAFYGSSLPMKGSSVQQWHQNKPGVLNASQNNEFWGASLASGDFNGDGCWDLSHGVPGENLGPANGAGQTNVLYGDGSGLQADDDQVWHQNRPGVGDKVHTDDGFGTAQTSSG